MSTEFPSRIHAASTQISGEPVDGQPPAEFPDRRNTEAGRKSPGLERRQFSDSHDSVSADAAELGRAIDQYKLVNRRRYVSYEELLSILKSLGYDKNSQ